MVYQAGYLPLGAPPAPLVFRISLGEVGLLVVVQFVDAPVLVKVTVIGLDIIPPGHVPGKCNS